MITLAALVAFIPLGSVAADADCPLTPLPLGDLCTLNGLDWVGDPELIEGTRKADDIDCRNSEIAVSIYGDGGDDTICGSIHGDFIAGGGGNDTLIGGNHADILDGGPGDDYIDGGWHTDECIEYEGDEDVTFNDPINCEI